MLGKYLMAHAGGSVAAIFDEDIQNHMGSNGYQFVSYDRHPKTTRKGAFGSTFWNTGAAQKPNDARGIANVRSDLFGVALDQVLKGEAPRTLKVGDSAYIPRGTVHRNQNLTDKPARSIELNIMDKDKPVLEPVAD